MRRRRKRPGVEPGTQVRLRIGLSTAVGIPGGPDWKPWMAGIREHLAAVHAALGEVLDAPIPDYLVLEDFGTRGLRGDPLQTEDDAIEAGAARNDFYYFWRNIGRSRKSASDLGRWGLGKTVFPAASRINAFFGFTVRADDGRRMLLGQAALRIHKVGMQRRSAHHRPAAVEPIHEYRSNQPAGAAVDFAALNPRYSRAARKVADSWGYLRV